MWHASRIENPFLVFRTSTFDSKIQWIFMAFFLVHNFMTSNNTLIRTKYCQIRKGRDPAGSESRLDFVQNAREERMTNENHVNWIWDSHEVPEQKANKTHPMVSADFNLKRSDIKARFIAAASSISPFAHSDAVVAVSCANSNLYFSCKSNAFRIRALVFNSL